MIRTTVSQPVRTGSAVVGVAGLLLLAGCSAPADSQVTETQNTPEAADGSSSSSGEYADGTYTAEGSYLTPESSLESVTVTMTLEGGVVADVEVEGEPVARESQQYQGQFISGIEDVVEGVALDELDVDVVSGSSLTSGGFNDAVETIKQQAQA